MNKSLFLFLLFCGGLASCSRDDLTVNVVRNPLITFDTDSASWKSDNYFFTGPATVVVYPNSATTGVLYNRYTIQASGKDTKGNVLQLNIFFDSADPAVLTGIYRKSYTVLRGLNQVELFKTGGVLSAYSLCAGDSITPVWQVQRQSTTERLVSGVFQMTLCNTLDTTQKINIKNGVFTDLHY